MDPQQNLEDFWEAFDVKNYEEALELAEALCDWVDVGGFTPDWGDRGWSAWCDAHSICLDYQEYYQTAV